MEAQIIQDQLIFYCYEAQNNVSCNLRVPVVAFYLLSAVGLNLVDFLSVTVPALLYSLEKCAI